MYFQLNTQMGFFPDNKSEEILKLLIPYLWEDDAVKLYKELKCCPLSEAVDWVRAKYKERLTMPTLNEQRIKEIAVNCLKQLDMKSGSSIRYPRDIALIEQAITSALNESEDKKRLDWLLEKHSAKFWDSLEGYMSFEDRKEIDDMIAAMSQQKEKE